MELYIKHGWKLNPNAKIVEGITKALERTGGYCPCYNNKYTGTNDSKCPCKAFREEDCCCCGLYVKDNETES